MIGYNIANNKYTISGNTNSVIRQHFLSDANNLFVDNEIYLVSTLDDLYEIFNNESSKFGCGCVENVFFDITNFNDLKGYKLIFLVNSYRYTIYDLIDTFQILTDGSSYYKLRVEPFDITALNSEIYSFYLDGVMFDRKYIFVHDFELVLRSYVEKSTNKNYTVKYTTDYIMSNVYIENNTYHIVAYQPLPTYNINDNLEIISSEVVNNNVVYLYRYRNYDVVSFNIYEIEIGHYSYTQTYDAYFYKSYRYNSFGVFTFVYNRPYIFEEVINYSNNIVFEPTELTHPFCKGFYNLLKAIIYIPNLPYARELNSYKSIYSSLKTYSEMYNTNYILNSSTELPDISCSNIIFTGDENSKLITVNNSYTYTGNLTNNTVEIMFIGS